jgi:hypothetical protein
MFALWRANTPIFEEIVLMPLEVSAVSLCNKADSKVDRFASFTTVLALAPQFGHNTLAKFCRLFRVPDP